MHHKTLILLIANLLTAGLALLINILIGRVLGTDGIGLYAAALAWVFPLRLLAEAGTTTLIIRESAQSEPDTLLRDTMPIRLTLGTLLTVLLCVGAPWISGHPATLQIAAPLILIEPFFGAFSAVFRSRGQVSRLLVLNTGMLAIQATLTAGALHAGASVNWLLTINTTTSAGQLAAAGYLWKRTATRASGNLPPQWDTARRAAPFAAAGVLAALHSRVPLILLERLVTASETGLFSAANRLIEAARLPPQAYFDVWFPAHSAAPPHQRPALLRAALRRVALYGILVSAVVALAPAALLTTIYGSDFAAGTTTLILLAAALPPGLIKGVYTIELYVQRREAIVNQITLVTLIVRLLMSLIVLPRWGAVGAAALHLVVDVFSASAFAMIAHTQRPFHIQHK